MRPIISALAAASLLAGTTASAAAAPAIPAQARADSPVDAAEQTAGNAWIWIAAAVVAGIILILLLDDDDPESP